jgi:hypothetical protein
MKHSTYSPEVHGWYMYIFFRPHLISDPTRARRAGPLRPDLVFVITFREIVPRTKKWSRNKDAPCDSLQSAREIRG